MELDAQCTLKLSYTTYNIDMHSLAALKKWNEIVTKSMTILYYYYT